MSDSQSSNSTKEKAAVSTDWEAVESSAEFRHLVARKRRFIFPATIFFLAFYFALPLLIGLKTDLMKQKVFGHLNWAFVFSLAQFGMTWIIAILYVRAAARFDRMEHELVEKLK